MRKKLLCVLCAALLFGSSLTALAAPAELPIAPSNSWTVSRNGGGDFVYHTLYRKL